MNAYEACWLKPPAALASVARRAREALVAIRNDRNDHDWHAGERRNFLQVAEQLPAVHVGQQDVQGVDELCSGTPNSGFGGTRGSPPLYRYAGSATSTRVVVFTTQYLVGDNPFPSLVDD